MSTIDFSVSRQNKEAGMVAIMVTLILMIVISLIVLGFAQISRRNQRQALDRQLSTQAFYAAETGINDAAEVIKAAVASGSPISDKPDCQSDGSGFYASLDAIIDSANNVEYTCLTVDPTPSTLVYSSIGTASTVVPLRSTGGSIASITFNWQTKSDSSTPTTGCPNTASGVFSATSAWSCGYGVVRFDLVRTDGTFTMADLQASRTMTAFMVPLRPGSPAANIAPNPIAHTTTGANNRLGVQCSDTGCAQTINGLSGDQYFLRISSVYKDVSLQIVVKDAADAPLKIQGAQAVIDATGKAEDVLRRVQVRIPLTASSTNLVSDYAIQTEEAICKRFSVMDSFFRNDADNAVPTVVNSTSNPLCKPGPQG